MSQRYELLYLLSTQVPETDLPAITDAVASFMTEHGGTISHNGLWARRKLTYPIGRNRSAYYWLIQYEGAHKLNADLTGFLNLHTEVIRFLITEGVAESDSVRSEAFAAKIAPREEIMEKEVPVVPAPSPIVATPPTPTPATPVEAAKKPMRNTDDITTAPKVVPESDAPKTERVDLDELDRKLGELLDTDLDK